MIFLPIVDRELRVAARRRTTYWGRVAMVFAASLFWLWASMTEALSGPTPSNGARLFNLLSSFAFGYALFAGLRSASDSLSREKREGTLGLLFLTDLKGYDVVLGKLAATSLGAFYGMVAVLPVLAIPLLMGGVAASTFWRMALVLLNTLFFSVASGLFASAVSRHERKAMGASFLVILFFTGGLPLIGFGINEWTGRVGAPLGFLLPSPALAFCRVITSPLWAGGFSEYWVSVAITHVLSWALLGVASLIAPHSWKDKPASVRRMRWREWWRGFVLGGPERQRAFRARLLEINPIFWLSSRERQMASYPWIFLACMGAIVIWAWRLDARLWLEFSWALFITFVLHLFLKVWVLTMACNSFTVDRDKGALELLLSTPLTVAQVLRGQWLGLRRHFLWPVVMMIACDVIWFAAGIVARRRGKVVSEETIWFAGAFVGNIAMFGLDLLTLGWVGMWMGMRSKRAGAAASGAVLRILVLPWILFAIVSLTITAYWALFGGGESSREWVLLILWFCIGGLIDLAYIPWARWKLRRDLRTMATQRFSSIPGEGTPAAR